jgi:hypothetical protein
MITSKANDEAKSVWEEIDVMRDRLQHRFVSSKSATHLALPISRAQPFGFVPIEVYNKYAFAAFCVIHCAKNSLNLENQKIRKKLESYWD